jgi:SAM-dependent methyltransferase
LSGPSPGDERHAYEGRDLEAMAYARNYHDWIGAEFRDAMRGDIAEVGAGDGRFALRILAAGPRSLTLFEPSKDMYARQPDVLGAAPAVRRENATLAERAHEFRGAFDSVIYNNVLEHVADDAGELRLVRESLRAGGAVRIFVPALPMLMSDFDRSLGHFRRYTKPGLKALVERAGFRIERLHYLDAPGVLPWLVVMRWGRGRLSQRKVQAYDRLVPLMRWSESRVRPPFGKNLLAVARRD